MYRPILKYPGGKFTLLERLFKHIPRQGHTLVEPFVGSGVFSLNTNYKHYILSDINPDVIMLYRMVIEQTECFIGESSKLYTQENNSEENYYRLREELNRLPFSFERAVIFLWLNRHCYNGLSRYNKGAGNFNVPYGRRKHPSFHPERIRFFAEKFKNADITVSNYQETLEKVEINSTVFCDPPYLPLTKTANFSDYAPRAFTIEDHKKLDKLCKNLSERGNLAFVCNHKSPTLNEVYTHHNNSVGFRVRRSIGASAKTRKKVPEVLLKY